MVSIICQTAYWISLLYFILYKLFISNFNILIMWLMNSVLFSHTILFSHIISSISKNITTCILNHPKNYYGITYLVPSLQGALNFLLENW